MTDLMIDLETMGRPPRGAIVAIGAVGFNIETGQVGEVLDLAVSLVSSSEMGMKIDPRTVLWWLDQDKEAVKTWLRPDAMDLTAACIAFMDWYGKTLQADRKTRIWAKGPSFDLVILQSALRRCKMGAPWHHRQERCVRTIIDQATQQGMVELERTELRHSAVEDCLYQIKQVHLAWGVLNR